MRSVVCLPTRNERDSIASMIREIKSLKLPLFVSDAHSDDGTQEIARKLKVPVHLRKCMGKGCGVQTAIEVAARQGYDVLVFIDCDHTYPVQAIPELIKLIGKHDMVVGARDYKNVPAINKLGNFAHNIAVMLLYWRDLKDINSGLRAIKVEKFKGIIDAKGFDIEAQLTVRALKKRMAVKEVPITYSQRRGESKLRLKDGVSILWRIVKERFMA